MNAVKISKFCRFPKLKSILLPPDEVGVEVSHTNCGVEVSHTNFLPLPHGCFGRCGQMGLVPQTASKTLIHKTNGQKQEGKMSWGRHASSRKANGGICHSKVPQPC
jgi:hypothetical protein